MFIITAKSQSIVFHGTRQKNEQNGKNDASGINVFSVKLQKICNAVKHSAIQVIINSYCNQCLCKKKYKSRESLVFMLNKY